MWKPADKNLEADCVAQSLKKLFSTVHTGSVSVCGDLPWAFTAYLTLDRNKLWLTSQETTKHVQILRPKRPAAVCLWQAPEKWGAPLFGIQLHGEIKEVLEAGEAEIGLEALHARFEGTRKTLPDVQAVRGPSRRTCLLSITCAAGSIRDERRLPKGRHAIEWQD